MQDIYISVNRIYSAIIQKYDAWSVCFGNMDTLKLAGKRLAPKYMQLWSVLLIPEVRVLLFFFFYFTSLAHVYVRLILLGEAGYILDRLSVYLGARSDC